MGYQQVVPHKALILQRIYVAAPAANSFFFFPERFLIFFLKGYFLGFYFANNN
jgi:hypothetical protein